MKKRVSCFLFPEETVEFPFRLLHKCRGSVGSGMLVTLCVLHLGILLLLLLALSGHLSGCCGGSGLLLLCLLDGLLLGALLCGGLLLGGEGGLTLLLELVEVALGDGATDGTDLVDLGLVDGLGGIVTLVVEPVL